jgi:hypothetical protein
VKHRDRYQAHEVRIRSSLDRVTGKAPASEAEIRAMAAKAGELGVRMFLLPDLQRLPEISRKLIETEWQRLYGRAQ